MMKNVLLGSTALVCFSLVAGAAQAACTSTAPTTGQAVSCTGTSTTPIVAAGGQNNVAVTLQDGAQLNTAATAVTLQDQSAASLLGSSQINTTGVSHMGVLIGNHGAVSLEGTSRITTANDTSIGINAGTNAAITLNDHSRIDTNGTQSWTIAAGSHSKVQLNGNSYAKTLGAYGRNISVGAYSSVEINGYSRVQTIGTHAYGVQLARGNSTVTLNDRSRIETGAGPFAYAIDIRDHDNNAVILNDLAIIDTNGTNSTAINLDHSSNNTITLAGGSIVTTLQAGANGIKVHDGTGNSVVLQGDALLNTTGANAQGIYFSDTRPNSVAMSGNAQINTNGAASTGIKSKGSGTVVTMSGHSLIDTAGTNASGIYIDGSSSAITLNDNAYIGATNVSGSTHAAIQLKNAANDVITLNGGSVFSTGYGIVAQGDYVHMNLHDNANVSTSNASTGSVIRIDGNYGVVNMDGTSSLISGSATGLLLNGDNNTLNMAGQSVISTVNAGANGVWSFGNNARITLQGSSEVRTGGNFAYGVYLNGDASRVTVREGSDITTQGTGAFAVNIKDNVASGTGDSVVNLGKIHAANATAIAVTSVNETTISNGGEISSDTQTAIIGSNTATDTVFNIGTIIGGNGTAIDLGGGNDTLVLLTGSHITGIMNGGAGNDTVILAGTGSEDDIFQNFETLQVASFGGSGPANWSLSGTSTFATGIDIVDGRLGVNGTLTSPVTTVHDNGILGGNGTLVSNVTSTGHIAPGNSVGTLTINGNFTQTGGAFDIEAGSGGVDRLNVLGAGGATLAGGPVLNILPTGGSTGGAGIILHANNGITGTFGTVNFQGNGAATITQTANDISLIAVDGTPAISGDFAASEAGLDFLDSVGDEQIAGLAHCGSDQCARLDDNQKHVWMKAFGHFGNEAARGGDQAFNYTIAGTAMGGDMHVTKDLSVGVSAGYSNTDETVSQHAATADINTGQLGLYANWQHGPFFVTGLLSGGWQSLDLSRNVGGGEADANTNGWLFGSSLQAGAQFSFPKGWRLTPSAGIAYQHQWIEGYSEHGAGAADVSIKGHQADALRLKAQLELANDIEFTGYTLTPHLTIGVQQQENLGGHATGAFSNGDGFTLNLKDDSRTIGTIGLGMEVGFQNGLSTYVNYDGALASGRTVQAVTGGLRYSW